MTMLQTDGGDGAGLALQPRVVETPATENARLKAQIEVLQLTIRQRNNTLKAFAVRLRQLSAECMGLSHQVAEAIESNE